MSSKEVPDQQSIRNEIQLEGQRTEATVLNQQPCQPDIHTVLRELSTKLAEVRVEMRYTKSQMEDLKKQNEAAEIRIKASEKEVEELRKQNEGQAQELRELQMSSNTTESQVRELKRENDYKIAFSASFSTDEETKTIGPFDADFTLKYTNVFVNHDNAYNPDTGVFTAPVKGIYTFRYSITGYGSNSTPVGARLFKNGQPVVVAYCQQPSHRVSTTNGASLLLEVGDVVYVQLYPKTQIYDNVYRYNTFTGQLLFTL